MSIDRCAAAAVARLTHTSYTLQQSPELEASLAKIRLAQEHAEYERMILPYAAPVSSISSIARDGSRQGSAAPKLSAAQEREAWDEIRRAMSAVANVVISTAAVGAAAWFAGGTAPVAWVSRRRATDGRVQSERCADGSSYPRTENPHYAAPVRRRCRGRDGAVRSALFQRRQAKAARISQGRPAPTHERGKRGCSSSGGEAESSHGRQRYNADSRSEGAVAISLYAPRPTSSTC